MIDTLTIAEPVQHYVIVLPSKSSEGCLDCLKARMTDNRFIRLERLQASELQLGFHDHKVIEELAREAELGPVDRYYAYHLFTKEIMKGRLLQYPQCPTCGVEESLPLLEQLELHSDMKLQGHHYRTKSFADVVESLKPLVSSLIHPVTGWFKQHFRSVSDSMPLIALDGYLQQVNYDAYGRNFTYKAAYYTAILEGLERHHGVAPHSFAAFHASEAELSEQGQAFHSLKQHLHFDAGVYDLPGFIYDRYSSHDRILWRYAYSLTRQAHTLIPEQIIYFSNHHFYREPKEKRYLPDSSNGVALGSTLEEATLSALFELIERDSFMVHWFSRSAPVRLEQLEGIPSEAVRLMLAYLDVMGYRVHLFDITLESGVPSFWVLLELKDPSNRDKLAFYTAAGANLHPVKAIESALIEATTSIRAFLVFRELKYKGKNVEAMVEDYHQVRFLEDHLYLYSSPRMARALAFATNSPRRIRAAEAITGYLDRPAPPTQRECVEMLVDRLKPHHPEILLANMTSRSLFKMGYNCVKAIIPSFQNISFGYDQQNINRDRIRQAVIMNRLDGDAESLNPDPHPFP